MSTQSESILHAWVLIPNHFPLICSFINNASRVMVIKNIRGFTAMKIMDAIINNPQESRKAWMLDLFEKNGQRYLHENPERAGL
ncbi:MAG TPA: hypothetical protein VFU62_05780 [Hanamia sp.]|nr:hypothetical protein [Hanamia sp.]